MLRRIIRLLPVYIGMALFMAQPFLVRWLPVHPVRELLLMAERLDVTGRLDLLKLVVFMLLVLHSLRLVRIQWEPFLLRLVLLAEPAKQVGLVPMVVPVSPVRIEQVQVKLAGMVLMFAVFMLLVRLRRLMVSMILIVRPKQARLVQVRRLVAYMPLLRQPLRVLFGTQALRPVRMDVRVLAA